MAKDSFLTVRVSPENPKWDNCTSRPGVLYRRSDDIRSAFTRDYNRILHCTAYRRLKHKTQVFFAPKNDHICTRIEHVNIVSAVSYTIAKHLGLNTELISAISIGHDLGHAPFGHACEAYIRELAKKEIGETFWHERNSLRFVDSIETLEGPNGHHENLNLTYAVRDGIICHCGEVDENFIRPREEFIDLGDIIEPNQYRPYTWEGCVAKVADKIAYLGRDIEDAITLDILTIPQVKELLKIVRPYTKSKLRELNNTVIMHGFIIDLCANSIPDEGVQFSKDTLTLMNLLKDFSSRNIYDHERLNNYKKYAKLIITSIYEVLKGLYRKERTVEEVKRYSRLFPTLSSVFLEWLMKYSSPIERPAKFRNQVLYDLRKEKDYSLAILDFIAGMTDMFAIKGFDEITSF